MTGPNAVEVETGIDADQLLSDVERFIGRFVAYPSDHARVAHTVWIAHTHMMDAWDSTPRIAFLSPEPGSGKSRALEVTELLVPRPIEAVNVTPAYLFRKVGSEDGRPTILYYEIDTVFGPKAKDNEEIRGLLNAGHRRHSVAGRCVVKGKKVETEEIPAYCGVALAGLGDLPDTILTRSIIVRMRRRAPNEHVDPYRRRLEHQKGAALCSQLAAWGAEVERWIGDDIPELPAGIVDRHADVWESLFAIAKAAGGDWPERTSKAATAHVKAASATPASLGVRLLGDLRTIFQGHDHLSTDDIIDRLCGLDESPWADLRGKPINARGLSQRLRPYQVKPKPIRFGPSSQVARGYAAEDLHDAWARYLTCLPSLLPTSPLQALQALQAPWNKGLL